MILLDLAEELQLSNNKCVRLNEDIAKLRIAAQPDDLDKKQMEWAGEMVRMHNLIRAFGLESRK